MEQSLLNNGEQASADPWAKLKAVGFKKGQSGNPKGRTKGIASLAEDLVRAFNAKHDYTIDGKPGKYPARRIFAEFIKAACLDPLAPQRKFDDRLVAQCIKAAMDRLAPIQPMQVNVQQNQLTVSGDNVLVQRCLSRANGGKVTAEIVLDELRLLADPNGNGNGQFRSPEQAS